MKHQVFVLGGIQTDFQRNWTKEGKGILAMLKEVVIDGLNEVNIDVDEIKQLNKKNIIEIFVGNFDSQQFVHQGNLGSLLTLVHPNFIGIPAARYEAACASGSIAIQAAMAKIKSGDIDVAVVIGIEIMKSVSPLVGGDFLGTASYYEKEAKGIAFPFPALFSQLTNAIIEKYSIKEKKLLDSFAEIARLNYENAKRNPKAQTRSWFMNKTHAAKRNDTFNPPIGAKLCTTDCSQITDGAVFLILVSEKYAKQYAKQNRIKLSYIPRIKGYGFRTAPLEFNKKIRQSRTSEYLLPWMKQAVDDAYTMAHMTINDIDTIETHDCFTSSEYIALSAFGLCRPGKEYTVIDTGIIDFNGTLPINPSGGLIGGGHPVGATGVRMMLDLYKQVTGKANAYQIPKAKNALMLNIGGSATTNNTFILGIGQ